MNPSDNDIRRAFNKQEIPEPSEAARREALQKAADKFVRKNVVPEKRSKGFPSLLRHMGKALQRFIPTKGVPIMTQRQFATVGVLVLAVGLVISIGTEVYRQGVPVTDLTQQVTVERDSTSGSGARQPAARKEGEVAEKKPAKNELAKLKQAQQRAQVDQYALAGKSAASLEEARRVMPSTIPASPLPGAPAEQAPGRLAMNRAVESMAMMDMASPGYYKDVGRDRFATVIQNPVKLVGEEPVSTFSIDVDTASYGFVRRQLNSGLLPQQDAVRVEEMINYFDYDYPVPADRSQPFKPSVALYQSPWNEHTRLLHIGIKGYDIIPDQKPRSNLVFLLDVSGSMNSPDKLPLLKNSFAMLVESLGPEDTVAIAVYAGAAGTVLEPTRVAEKGKILSALDKLQAGGSTAGGEGIRLAYALAEANFDAEAVNRVILATDGDFNVGITDQEELKSYIERKRKTGIYLSILGFGQGNYNDSLMQTLAQNGNGNAAYIDNLNEARKVLVDEAASTLFTIANDVKIQIEFNPAQVHDYRLIGYETRLLNREDFNNDKVDAGDVGSGHSVTAIYEITPVESSRKLVDDLRYQQDRQAAKPDASGEYAFLKIRYKLPDQEMSKLLTMPVTAEQAHAGIDSVPADMRFAAAVAAFGQLLRNDPYTGTFTYDDVIGLADAARGNDPFGYRSEFLNLVRLAKTARAM